MHKDFLTAIQHNEPLSAVYQRLCETEEDLHTKILKGYARDKAVAEHVLIALNEPGTEMFEWAQSYRRQAEADESRKTETEKSREAKRRALEREYLKLKEKKTEEMRKRFQSEM